VIKAPKWLNYKVDIFSQNLNQSTPNQLEVKPGTPEYASKIKTDLVSFKTQIATATEPLEKGVVVFNSFSDKISNTANK
jgi:hypothetical protein